MIHAYDEVYLEDAQDSFGHMLDYAVNELHYEADDFFGKFIASGYAERFGRGESQVIAGMSGIELAYAAVEDQPASEASRVKMLRENIRYAAGRSREYWAGWALAYYQWQTGVSFSEIVKRIPIDEILKMYTPFHEMDIRQFADRMDEMYLAAEPETNLKRRRCNAGISQAVLSEFSGVPVRTIQQYEQRQKDINKAQGETLLKFAQVLNCRMEDLIERVFPKKLPEK